MEVPSPKHPDFRSEQKGSGTCPRIRGAHHGPPHDWRCTRLDRSFSTPVTDLNPPRKRRLWPTAWFQPRQVHRSSAQTQSPKNVTRARASPRVLDLSYPALGLQSHRNLFRCDSGPECQGPVRPKEVTSWSPNGISMFPQTRWIQVIDRPAPEPTKRRLDL